MGLAILGTTQPILFHCGTVNGPYKRGLSNHLTTEIYGAIASFLEGGKCSEPARRPSSSAALAGMLPSCQRQRFVDRFRHTTRLRIQLFTAGRWRRVFVFFS